MSADGFRAWEFANQVERHITAGDLDRHVDSIRLALNRRWMRLTGGAIHSKSEMRGTLDAVTGKVLRPPVQNPVVYIPGDLVVTRDSAPVRRALVKCVVVKVHDRSLWVKPCPPPGNQSGRWERMTMFQRLRGFNVLKEDVDPAHTTPDESTI